MRAREADSEDDRPRRHGRASEPEVEGGRARAPKRRGDDEEPPRKTRPRRDDDELPRKTRPRGDDDELPRKPRPRGDDDEPPRKARRRGDDEPTGTSRRRSHERDDVPPEEYDDPPMTIWDHLNELRSRLVKAILAVTVGAVAAWFFKDRILGFIIKPLDAAWKKNAIPGDLNLHFTSVVGAFVNYLKLALLTGLVVGAPVVFFQLWRFVAPGLYRREKRYVIPFVFATSVLFALGCFFGYYIAFPYAFEWLLSLAGPISAEGARLTPTLMMSEYVDLVTKLALAFGLIFEIPIITLSLSMIGVVNYLQLIRFFRWWVVIAFVVAAIVTPPDLGTTQLLMATPMIALYGLSIGLCYLLGKKPTAEQRLAYAEAKRERKARRAGKKRRADD